MMNVLEEIRSSGKKPKELVTFLAKMARQDGKLLGQLGDCLKSGSVAERGICMEVLEYVSKDCPELVKPRLEAAIGHLNDEDAPKVKWEAARVIGNVARKFPDEASKAVPKLLLNTKDAGTVVRWSAAYALGEIAKHNNNAKMRKSLVPKIAEMANKEKNNGVRNVYLRALKVVGKT